LTALQLSGLPSDAFVFAGFLPSKQGQRRNVLERWSAVDAPLIVFETGPRLLAALEDIETVLGERQVVIARELTKRYEDVRRGDVSDLIECYKSEPTPKGEIVLVIGPADKQALSDADIDAALKKALETMPTKKAAAHVAAQTDLSKTALYDRALELKER
jgi:16S rRNA (cytidine1402-2'-O)-methyltransferase